MAAVNTNYTQSFAALNYSGFLFNKGNTATPLTSMISGRMKTTNSVEFSTGVEYTSGTGSQPAISEDASLVAPNGSTKTREQKTNVTQIFQYTYGVSDAKESNMGTMSGINIAGQQANPISERAFQRMAVLNKCGQDIEYTLLNGTYAKATDDDKVNKTRGLLNAISSDTTNNIAGASLTYWDVCDTIKAIKDKNAPTNNLVLGVDSVTRLQINADATQNNLTIVDRGRNINGINILEYVTPMGTIGIVDLNYLPAGTAVLFNPSVLAPVHQLVPGKGNFYEEELAKLGAGTRWQIFGQLGLDHGPAWYHGKITGISTTFVHPGKESSSS